MQYSNCNKPITQDYTSRHYTLVQEKPMREITNPLTNQMALINHIAYGTIYYNGLIKNHKSPLDAEGNGGQDGRGRIKGVAQKEYLAAECIQHLRPLRVIKTSTRGHTLAVIEKNIASCTTCEVLSRAHYGIETMKSSKNFRQLQLKVFQHLHGELSLEEIVAFANQASKKHNEKSSRNERFLSNKLGNYFAPYIWVKTLYHFSGIEFELTIFELIDLIVNVKGQKAKCFLDSEVTQETKRQFFNRGMLNDWHKACVFLFRILRTGHLSSDKRVKK